ncbi:unnamed protein product [Heligmosomoides polygyrus]|uniref:Ribonuclease P n=1 Tax=Heligmosomoides polygyrus TaxID=6339 RepID=A0A183G0F2_HELPZ|nr:unnamed protein product [Heligmosomoides polygyrus]
MQNVAVPPQASFAHLVGYRRDTELLLNGIVSDERADLWTVMRCNRLIRHGLGVCDNALVATPNKDIVNLRFSVRAIKRDEVGATLSKFGIHDGEVICKARAHFAAFAAAAMMKDIIDLLPLISLIIAATAEAAKCAQACSRLSLLRRDH